MQLTFQLVLLPTRLNPTAAAVFDSPVYCNTAFNLSCFFLHVVAPEIFDCVADECDGYGFPVDWWSLGIVAYEMFFGARPFDIHSTTSVSEVRALFAAGAVYPRSSRASRGFVDLIDRVSIFSNITVCTETRMWPYAYLNLILLSHTFPHIHFTIILPCDLNFLNSFLP